VLKLVMASITRRPPNAAKRASKLLAMTIWGGRGA
jgi:hypothetical protein